MRLLIHSLGGSAWNMAVDEALLRECREPVLRFYGWCEPAVSIGYFQCCSVVPKGRVFVRRYTGGGLVDHGADVTYSIVTPRGHEFYQMGAARSYEAAHRVIAEGLKDCGARVELAKEKVVGAGDACFQKPVKFDVMLNGRKVAGAAQRRTREGCLHQGSILLDALESRLLNLEKIVEALAPRLCVFLGSKMEESVLTFAEEKRAAQLERERYGTLKWNEAR
ncbi:MAG: biotin/lipoate A/B protein ligase family protein [bacterium]